MSAFFLTNSATVELGLFLPFLIHNGFRSQWWWQCGKEDIAWHLYTKKTESSQRYLVLLVLHGVAVVQVLCCPHKEVIVTQWGAGMAEHVLGQKVCGQMEFWVIRLRPCSNVCHVSVCRLVFGTLYPAYYSYKAVKTKNVKEYVSWHVNVFAVHSSLHAGSRLSSLNSNKSMVENICKDPCRASFCVCSFPFLFCCLLFRTDSQS